MCYCVAVFLLDLSNIATSLRYNYNFFFVKVNFFGKGNLS